MKTAFCFDLDGTLTYEEILPMLAKEIDLYEEIKILTDITINGSLSFTQSFKLRVKLLSEILIPKAQELILNVSLQKNVINFIKNNKNDCFVITGNLDVWVDRLIREKIGCDYFSSKANFADDKIIGISNILQKDNAVLKIKNNYDRIVAIGDGMNDIPMFENANISIAYGAFRNPNESLIKLATYVTYSEEGLCNILNTL
ncbi:MAG TPA: HAD-IB family phosphatase [Rickettsiales bacterium]|nr:HAD-IB family phosphatase [Rickettsiales bacterium]